MPQEFDRNLPNYSSRFSNFSSESAPNEAAIPALRIKELSFYYGTRQVLEGVSLNIPKGLITAIIGPSGCGKSTFLKALNRIGELEGKVKVTGTVEFFGQDIYHRRVNINRLRRNISMVFQKPNPFPISIYDNVAYGVRIFGRMNRFHLDEVVESALRNAALWDEVKHNLHTSALGLSGGQQQRLCIARALAVQPKVLLMDEPCSALDPISTKKIEELLQELRSQLTIAIVTHNMQQAARISDYTAFFNTDETYIGRLIECGQTNQIFTLPNNPSTRDYIQGNFG